MSFIGRNYGYKQVVKHFKMKSYLILILLLIRFNKLIAQDKFSYDQNGLSPVYLVNKVDNLSNKKLFEKTLEWVKKNYKNPDEVIKNHSG